MGTRLAGLYVTEGTDIITIDDMEHLRQWTIAADSGADAQLETDSIEIKVSGDQFAQATLSFLGEEDVTYYAELRVNGAIVGQRLITGVTVTQADALHTMVVIGAGRLNAGDKVSIYVGSNAVGGATFQLVYGQFGVMSL